MDDHVCNEDSVKTMAMIKKDSKACPKCAQFIFKIDGCSQMYCVDCNTAFDWNTMKIVTGVIHNPHYYEFMRANNNGIIPRNPGECNGLIGQAEMDRYLITTGLSKRHVRPEYAEYLFKIHRLTAHIAHDEIPRLNVNEHDNKDLRVRYLMNELTEDDFKREVQRREKVLEKRRDHLNIYQMFVDTSTDLFRVVFKPLQTGDQLEKNIKEHSYIFNNLIEYFNKECSVLGQRYSIVYNVITDYTFKGKRNL